MPQSNLTNGQKVNIRQLRRYRRMREELLAELGGKCMVCASEKKLEFDHPKGRDYRVEKLSPWMRIKRYRADLEAGNLRILCSKCNKKYLP
jgi:5-methylcytosine-specific restriction endonuclease McrA